MRKLIKFVPLILLAFICLFFLLFIFLEKDPNSPPSALIDKQLPEFTTVSLYNANIKLSSDNIETYTLINFFASWCTPCRAEHHLFFKIKDDYPNIFLVGIAHKDNPENSRKYLSEVRTLFLPSLPIIFITLLSFFSGFPNLNKANLILLRSKLIVFLNWFFLASRL